MPYAEQALRLNPFAPAGGIGSWAWPISLQGGMRRLSLAHKKSLNRTPKDLLTHIALTTAYSWAGRHEDARAQAAEVLRINPSFSVEERAESFCIQESGGPGPIS